MKKIRLKYEKNEDVKYIGHLDTITMFDRTFRRADINLKFSRGFNPRANISFALPTSTGIISKCEYLEFEIDDAIDINQLKEKLNVFLPNGFTVVEIKYIEDKKSLMSKVIEAEHIIELKYNENDKKIMERLQSIFNNHEILVKNKKGIIINIKPYILKYSIEKKDKSIELRIVGTAGSSNNLRPDLVLKAIENNNIKIFDYEIIKNNVILKE